VRGEKIDKDIALEIANATNFEVCLLELTWPDRSFGIGVRIAQESDSDELDRRSGD
jgi:hypothetical protein